MPVTHKHEVEAIWNALKALQGIAGLAHSSGAEARKVGEAYFELAGALPDLVAEVPGFAQLGGQAMAYALIKEGHGDTFAQHSKTEEAELAKILATRRTTS